MSDDLVRALVPWGYAPGDYECKCSRCLQRHGADKRASMCRDCATLLARKSFDKQAIRIRELEAEIERLRAAQQWRPIAEAPKDKWIPVGWRDKHGNWREAMACWDGGLKQRWVDDDWNELDEPIIEGAWTDYESDDHGLSSRVLHPTMFCLLPTPPEEVK